MFKLPLATAASFALITSFALTPLTATAGSKEDIAAGKKLSFDRKLGNCIACHVMDKGVAPGNIGPPLIAMKARYPDVKKLREQIANPLKANPNSRMPPFGVHGALTDKQIDQITAYIHTL